MSMSIQIHIKLQRNKDKDVDCTRYLSQKRDTAVCIRNISNRRMKYD